MVERPILFSDPMVRAILDGRKTQTRRIVKPQEAVEPDPDDESIANWVHDHRRPHPCDYSCSRHEFSVCPYGVPGDRLWVKEAWRPRIAHHCCMDTCDCADVVVAYQADGAEVYFPESRIADDWLMPKAAKRGNVSPLFMPRWASRLTLEITEVRVERLQAISEEDARAEGVEAVTTGQSWKVLCKDGRCYDCFAEPDASDPEIHSFVRVPDETIITARDAFASLWDRINGDRASWDANPWVWALTFRRVEAAQEAA